jgi:hypothetical protein
LASALAIAFGLVGVDLAHALEQFFGAGFIHLGRAWAFTAASAAARKDWLWFLYAFWHI